MHEPEAKNPSLKRHTRKPQDARGLDAPFPKLRRQNFEPAIECNVQRVDQAGKCIGLPPGSKLASRFPHHVKREAADLRAAPG